MIYDKKTGDVIIIDKSHEKRKKIIQNLDDLKEERSAMQQEIDGASTPEGKAEAWAKWQEHFE